MNKEPEEHLAEIREAGGSPAGSCADCMHRMPMAPWDFPIATGRLQRARGDSLRRAGTNEMPALCKWKKCCRPGGRDEVPLLPVRIERSGPHWD